MDITAALEFLGDHHHGVLVTRRRDGSLQTSPVLAGVDGNDRVIISSREPAYKVRNLRRDPHAVLCIFTDQFFGSWVQVEGTATIVSLPEAMEPLVDYYRRLAGEHPDWAEYRDRMVVEQRVLIRITVEAAGPDRFG